MRELKIPLLVVDLQIDLLPEDPTFLLNAVESARADALFTVFVTRCNAPDSLFFRQLRSSQCMSGSMGVGLAVARRPEDQIMPRSGYGLPGPALDLFDGFGSVNVCGLESDSGVLACSFSLWDRGIVPRVIPSACHSASGPRAHAAAMSTFYASFGI